MNALPTYKDSIQGFTPPPSYQDVITFTNNTTLLPNEQSSPDYYVTKQFGLIEVEDIDQVCDEQILDFFETMHEQEEGFHSYQSKSNEEIADLITSIELTLNEKLVQINRNASFINKKIKSRNNNYYINTLRCSTFKDFMRIKQRVANGLSTLYEDVYFPLTHFNAMFDATLSRITSLESELSETLETQTHTPTEASATTSKQELINRSQALYVEHYKLAQIRYNLNQIQANINQLISCDDVSYVLKERARVYNDAKQIVFNQQRACLIQGNC